MVSAITWGENRGCQHIAVKEGCDGGNPEAEEAGGGREGKQDIEMQQEPASRELM